MLLVQAWEAAGGRALYAGRGERPHPVHQPLQPEPIPTGRPRRPHQPDQGGGPAGDLRGRSPRPAAAQRKRTVQPDEVRKPGVGHGRCRLHRDRRAPGTAQILPRTEHPDRPGRLLSPSAFRSRAIEWAETVHQDTELLGSTTTHVYFSGPKKKFRVRYDRIVDFEP